MRLSEDNEDAIREMNDPRVIEESELRRLEIRAKAVELVDEALGERAS